LAAKKNYEKEKLRYTNQRLEEIVTSSFEKEKIAETDSTLVQVIDPVYQEPVEAGKFFSLTTHFLSPLKFIFGRPVSTFTFNLLVIWLINGLLFFALYFNLFRKLFTLFDKKIPASTQLSTSTH